MPPTITIQFDQAGFFSTVHTKMGERQEHPEKEAWRNGVVSYDVIIGLQVSFLVM